MLCIGLPLAPAVRARPAEAGAAGVVFGVRIVAPLRVIDVRKERTGMADTNDPRSESSPAAMPAPRESATTAATDGPGLASDRPPQLAQQQPQTTAPSADTAAERSETRRPEHRWRKRLLLLVVLGGLAYGGYSLVPAVETALNTVSTDDAYVNGHVTFVAPRVAGQVSRVLVDDNMRVKRGSLLVQLDREPYQVVVAIKQAAVTAAEADLTAARARCIRCCRPDAGGPIRARAGHRGT